MWRRFSWNARKLTHSGFSQWDSEKLTKLSSLSQIKYLYHRSNIYFYVIVTPSGWCSLDSEWHTKRGQSVTFRLRKLTVLFSAYRSDWPCRDCRRECNAVIDNGHLSTTGDVFPLCTVTTTFTHTHRHTYRQTDKQTDKDIWVLPVMSSHSVLSLPPSHRQTDRQTSEYYQ